MFYTGWPVQRTGWLAHCSAEMDSLITIVSVGALRYSLLVD